MPLAPASASAPVSVLPPLLSAPQAWSHSPLHSFHSPPVHRRSAMQRSPSLQLLRLQSPPRSRTARVLPSARSHPDLQASIAPLRRLPSGACPTTNTPALP